MIIEFILFVGNFWCKKYKFLLQYYKNMETSLIICFNNSQLRNKNRICFLVNGTTLFLYNNLTSFIQIWTQIDNVIKN